MTVITELSIAKVDKSDPRYPDPIPDGRKFSDVYLLWCKTDDGRELECPCFVLEHMTPLTTENASKVLKFFATAIASIDTKAEAA